MEGRLYYWRSRIHSGCKADTIGSGPNEKKPASEFGLILMIIGLIVG